MKHPLGTALSLKADYSRQMTLSQVGVTGQRRLSDARVLVVGAGGLGAPVLSYLAGAGIGTLGIVDDDVLAASNLHRQTIYSVEDVGKPKAELAALRLRAINPEIEVRAHAYRLVPSNVAALMRSYDIVVDCTDNFATKFLINDAAVLSEKPAVFASIYQYEGQLQVYRPNQQAESCLRCFWPVPTPDGLIGTCQQAGVLGPVPGVLGSLQALEVLKICLDLPGQLHSEILLIDLLTLSIQRIKAPRYANCRQSACTRVKPIVDAKAEVEIEITFADLRHAVAAGYTLIDIREHSEVALHPITEGRKYLHIPMNDLLMNPQPILSERVLLLCAKGVRSKAAATQLRRDGHSGVYSLKAGIPPTAVSDAALNKDEKSSSI